MKISIQAVLLKWRVLKFVRRVKTAQTIEAKSQPIIYDLFVKNINEAISSRFFSRKRQPNTGGRYISRDLMESMKEILPDDDVSKKIRAFGFPHTMVHFKWLMV